MNDYVHPSPYILNHELLFLVYERKCVLFIQKYIYIGSLDSGIPTWDLGILGITMGFRKQKHKELVGNRRNPNVIAGIPESQESPKRVHFSESPLPISTLA